MSLLALIMGAVISGSTVIQYGNQPLDIDRVEQVSTQTIQHRGYSSGDTRQLMVQRAYELGGIDFVTMIECESGFNPNARGDSGKAYGLCQINTRWHKLPNGYKTDWRIQVEECYRLRKGHTAFYGPARKINGQLCKDYVLDRFIIQSGK